MIRATAPGKLILAGEHAAVYGRPALVAAVDARTRVTVGGADQGSVRLVLPDVDCDETTTWQVVERYGDAARRAWEDCREVAGFERLMAMATGDPAHVVKVALAETVRDLEVAPGGVVVHVRSELPVGAGFGSSASVGVATIGACAMHLTGQVEPARVGRVALEVERRQHGRPSGADHATVLFGGVQWFERGREGQLVQRALRFDRRLLGRLRVFHTGRPVESTGELVEAVRQRFAERPGELQEVLGALEADTRGLRETLVGDAEEGHGVAELLTRYERGLERLGVVPAAVRESIRAFERAGGAAKISGAGALSGSAAGALLAYSVADETSLEALSDYERRDVLLGAPGLELESNVEEPEA